MIWPVFTFQILLQPSPTLPTQTRAVGWETFRNYLQRYDVSYSSISCLIIDWSDETSNTLDQVRNPAHHSHSIGYASSKQVTSYTMRSQLNCITTEIYESPSIQSRRTGQSRISLMPWPATSKPPITANSLASSSKSTHRTSTIQDS